MLTFNNTAVYGSLNVRAELQRNMNARKTVQGSAKRLDSFTRTACAQDSGVDKIREMLKTADNSGSGVSTASAAGRADVTSNSNYRQLIAITENEVRNVLNKISLFNEYTDEKKYYQRLLDEIGDSDSTYIKGSGKYGLSHFADESVTKDTVLLYLGNVQKHIDATVSFKRYREKYCSQPQEYNFKSERTNEILRKTKEEVEKHRTPTDEFYSSPECSRMVYNMYAG